MFDDVGSVPAAVGVRGAYVAMGNVMPGARETVLGRQAREGEGSFNPATGQGRGAAKDGQYTRALKTCEVLVLLFSTFGGMGPDVLELVHRAAEVRNNKLRGEEYDRTTWAARSWTTYTMQKVSCALMRAVATEVATSMGLTRVRDARE